VSRFVHLIDKCVYPTYGNNWDDTLFRKAILAYLKPEHKVLDLGAGAGVVHQMNFKGIAERVCGVDPDPRVVKNPFLDEGVVGSGDAIPYSNRFFDIVFANNVLEHVAVPDLFLQEVPRVLKEGGWFFAKTPNRYHYVPTIARFTPHWFHEFAVKLRGRASVDTFPTWYRLNDRKTITRYAQEKGFVPYKIDLIEGRPEYLRINPIFYLIGIFYEKLVNSTRLLEPFRVILITHLRKL
jgi:SAM-dependent methyltransferase